MTELSTRTVERALNLLAAICEGNRLNLTEASRAVGLSPSTALRLLRTLEASGFVHKDEDGTYRPGSRLIQLGAQSLSNESLIVLCRSEMEGLVEVTGESVYLSVKAHQATALYIAIVEGTHSVRHASWVGRVIPMRDSASGHVLDDRIPVDGYVVMERGIETDVTAIAAPIRSGGRVVAALSLVVPSYRVAPTDTRRFGSLLVRTTERVSAGLSSSIPAPAPTSQGAPVV